MQTERKNCQNAEWYRKREAGEDPGPWTDLMERWFRDPNSPKSRFWAAYDICRPPEENNPAGWGLLPAELKDDPFLDMILDVDIREFLIDDAYEEGLAILDDYMAEHGDELEQAMDERRGYLAMLDPGLEALQDDYYDLGSQDEKRAFREAHSELVDYWERKREYKSTHPLLVEYYFPDYQAAAGGQYRAPTYSRRGGGRRPARRPPEREDGWARFVDIAGAMVVGALIDSWTGQRELDAIDLRYLRALFEAYPLGTTNFESWLLRLKEMWQASASGGMSYEIPMRRRPVTVQPTTREEPSRDYWRRPPTRIRHLRGA